MATIIRDIGTVAYAGYVFDGASNITIRCEPVMDDANRTVIYHRYTINVKAIVADSSGTGAELQNIRYRLTKQGQALIVYNRGFYDLFVNTMTTGSVNDVAFGPKPKLVSWTPIGSLYAAEVEWVCETCIVYCALPKYHQGIMAFNYGVTYALDYRGLTTRTIAGYYEIAMTRTGYTIPDCCDNYRTVVNPVIPERFQRTSQNYQLSLDKRRCDFSVVDTEIPSNNPYPNGVARIDAKHRVHWNRRSGQLHTLRNTITVEIEMAPDQPMLNAYAAFAAIVKQRVDIAKAAIPPPAPHSQEPVGVLIDEMSAEESLFDRKCSFTVGYRILQPLSRLLTDTGLWTPLGLNTWAYWRSSIVMITDQRGYANMSHPSTADSIIDPCGTSFQQTWDPATTPKPQQSQETRELLKNETPSAENSWMEYDSHILVMRDRAVVRHAILQAADAEDVAANLQAVDILDYPGMGGISDIIQRGGKSRYTIILQGKARRAGHSIPKPAITTVGGAPTTLKHDGFKHEFVGNYLGVPVWSAKWKQVYTIGEAPGVVPPPENVGERIDAAGVAAAPVGP